MSHYTKVETQFRDPDALVAALSDLGKPAVVHDEAVHLTGWKNHQRPETAEVVVLRKHVGRAANDIGFKLQQDGTYQAIISEHERDFLKYDADWLRRLRIRYAYHTVKSLLPSQHLEVAEEQVTDSRVRLIARR